MVVGSVEFFRKMIRIALFVVLPAALVALVALTVLYFVQIGGMSNRIHDLEDRILQLEATNSALHPSASEALIRVRREAMQASVQSHLVADFNDILDEGDLTIAPVPTATPAPSPSLSPTLSNKPTPDVTGIADPSIPVAPSLAPSVAPTFSLFPDFHKAYPVFAPVESKTAYLTFDDGPSDRTLEVLDILDHYHIKAVFFEVDSKNAKAASIMREVIQRGDVIGMHSATHVYTAIYKSVDAFVTDLETNYRFILSATGVAPQFFRFAGGSNTVYAAHTGEAIRAEMTLRGFAYYDWNCSSGDGNSANNDPAGLAANVFASAKGKTRLIVLSHDSEEKTATVKALPMIIEGLLAQGYHFELLTPDVKPISFTTP